MSLFQGPTYWAVSEEAVQSCIIKMEFNNRPKFKGSFTAY